MKSCNLSQNCPQQNQQTFNVLLPEANAQISFILKTQRDPKNSSNKQQQIKPCLSQTNIRSSRENNNKIYTQRNTTSQGGHQTQSYSSRQSQQKFIRKQKETLIVKKIVKQNHSIFYLGQFHYDSLSNDIKQNLMKFTNPLTILFDYIKKQKKNVLSSKRPQSILIKFERFGIIEYCELILHKEKMEQTVVLNQKIQRQSTQIQKLNKKVTRYQEQIKGLRATLQQLKNDNFFLMQKCSANSYQFSLYEQQQAKSKKQKQMLRRENQKLKQELNNSSKKNAKQFKGQSKLVMISKSFQQYIESCQSKLLKNMHRNKLLQQQHTINLQNQRLIQCPPFQTLFNLEEIVLNNNYIRDISPLNNNFHIRVLLLDFNEFARINEVFLQFQNLETLSMQGNFLKQIENIPSKVLSLNLSQNMIQNPSQELYEKEFQFLDLRNNKFKQTTSYKQFKKIMESNYRQKKIKTLKI